MANKTLRVSRICTTDSNNLQLFPKKKHYCHVKVAITGKPSFQKKYKKLKKIEKRVVVDEDGRLKPSLKLAVAQDFVSDLALVIDLKSERFILGRSFGKTRIKVQDLLHDWDKQDQATQCDLATHKIPLKKKMKGVVNVSYKFTTHSTSPPPPLQLETGGLPIVSRLKGVFFRIWANCYSFPVI